MDKQAFMELLVQPIQRSDSSKERAVENQDAQRRAEAAAQTALEERAQSLGIPEIMAALQRDGLLRVETRFATWAMGNRHTIRKPNIKYTAYRNGVRYDPDSKRAQFALFQDGACCSKHLEANPLDDLMPEEAALALFAEHCGILLANHPLRASSTPAENPVPIG